MRFDAHQDYITDVGIRGFGRHVGRGLRAAGGARVDGRRTNHSLVRSGFTNSRKSGSPQRDNTA